MELFFSVLVVDDSLIIVKKLTNILEKVGFRVIKTAGNGKQAVAAYRACKPDVVTMDITMPEMDGIEATRAIVKEFPDAKIVMVTSHGQEKMVLDAIKAGAKGYVLKPFQEHKVYEAIQKACNTVVVQEKLKIEMDRRERERLQKDKEELEKTKVEESGPPPASVPAQASAPAPASAPVKPTAPVQPTPMAPVKPTVPVQPAVPVQPTVLAQPVVAPPVNSTPPKPKFCQECGNPIIANAKFCAGCGIKLI